MRPQATPNKLRNDWSGVIAAVAACALIGFCLGNGLNNQLLIEQTHIVKE